MSKLDSIAQEIIARQQAAEALKLPTDRQPYVAELQPQEPGLEHPEISPEEVIAGGVAGPLARGVLNAAPVMGSQLGALAADEAGVLRLGGNMSPAPLYTTGYKAGVSKAAANEAFQAAAQQEAAMVPKVSAHGVSAPNAAALETQKLGRAADFADRAKAQKAARRGFADGGEITLEDYTREPAAVAPPTPEAPISAPQPPQVPQTTNLISPYGEVVGVDQSQLQDALSLGYKVASPEEVHSHKQEEKYGTAGQIVKTGLEGIAQGVAGPLAPAIEKAFGVDPADIRGREEVNPGTHMIGQGVGLIGGAVTGVGEGALLETAGNAVRAALPAGKATFISQVGPEAIKGAFEMGLFQDGEELAKVFKEDPNQTAETAMSEIGLATVLGGVFGGVAGAALQKAKYAGLELPEVAQPAGSFVSEMDRPALEAGALRESIMHADHLPANDKKGMLAGLLDRAEKIEAPEIKAAAKRLGIDPLEGMISENTWVQKAEDSLINGAPTYSGVRRKTLYNEVYGKAANAANEALGEGSMYSKAELGDIMKKSISAQIEEQNAPIKALYDELKAVREVLPLQKDATQELASGIKELQELKISPSSPEGKLAARIIRESPGYKTVDDIQLARSMLNRSISPTASSGEKRMAGVLSDMLTKMEESTIEKYASSMAKTNPQVAERIGGMIAQKKAADQSYKGFITKIKELSERLGKGRVYGTQDALHFINERLTPEEIVERLGTAKDSEFRKFFAKEYPEQSAMMRDYQKGALREKASATGELSPKVLFNNINKMEPEIQKSLFSAAELQKMKDSETIIRSMPKNFNPSGTSHAMAMRDFFVHPKGAALSNLRDFAMEKFIKGVAGSPGATNASTLAQATVKGNKLADKAIKAVFAGVALPAAAIPTIASREALSKLVDMYAANPDKLFNTGDNNPVPEYAQAFAAANARAIQYLSTLRPNTDPKAPLDAKRKPDSFAVAKYNRALDIAQQPLSVIAHIKRGTLTIQDVVTLKTIYPSLYNGLSQKIMSQVVDSKSKDKQIPYNTRLQLGLFLGQPLDSSMTPQSILSIQGGMQSQAAPESAQQVSKPPSQASMKGLQKLPQSYQTPGQAGAMRRQSRD